MNEIVIIYILYINVLIIVLWGFGVLGFWGFGEIGRAHV